MDNEIPNFFFDPEVAKKVTETGQKLVRELEAKLKYIDIDMRPRIGSYYGNLVTFEEFVDNEDYCFETNGLQGRQPAIDFFGEMKRLGVEEIIFDADEHGIDTAFIKINTHPSSRTDLAELMVHIHTQRPDEFTRQDDQDWFRLWWD